MFRCAQHDKMKKGGSQHAGARPLLGLRRAMPEQADLAACAGARSLFRDAPADIRGWRSQHARTRDCSLFCHSERSEESLIISARASPQMIETFPSPQIDRLGRIRLPQRMPTYSSPSK
jgi:hypothetical protein